METMLDDNEIRELAILYLRRVENPEDFASYEASWDVDEIVRTDCPLAWRLVCEMFIQAKTKREISCAAAGPLEDILKKYREELKDDVEHLFGESKRFQYALSTIYLQSNPSLEWLEQIASTARATTFSDAELGVQ